MTTQGTGTAPANHKDLGMEHLRRCTSCELRAAAPRISPASFTEHTVGTQWTVEASTSVSFETQTLRKENLGQPVLKADRPWEDSTIGMLGVSAVHDGERYLMWYRASWYLWGCAESPDGLTWSKPNLGLVNLDELLLRDDG